VADCAASFVIAVYLLSTPHSSRFARLASGAFYFAIHLEDFLQDHQIFFSNDYGSG
jgi:hypothetical protein